MTPAEVKACSVWEFSSAVNGWIDAHVPGKPGAMTASEEDMLWAAVQEKMGRVQ
jgi:hypothetical protein